MSDEERQVGIWFPRGEVVPLREMERRYVLYILALFGGNRTHTARALGIGTNTLWRKLKSWGVKPGKPGGCPTKRAQCYHCGVWCWLDGGGNYYSHDDPATERECEAAGEVHRV